MTETMILQEQHDHVLSITLNRVDKHNAFDDHLLSSLKTMLEAAQDDVHIRVLVLKANGKHFSAGADLQWMQRMASYTEEQNQADAMILADLMYTLHHFPKPCIAMVQGAAMGGGAGLVACADIAIATHTARFCFSEVKLGLIPAVISPYVIKAIGERAALALFMSAEIFSADRAYALQLVHEIVPEEQLLERTMNLAHHIARLAPQAVKDCKSLVRYVATQTLDQALVTHTASLIAQKRISTEGQKGLHAFLHQETPHWD